MDKHSLSICILVEMERNQEKPKQKQVLDLRKQLSVSVQFANQKRKWSFVAWNVNIICLDQQSHHVYNCLPLVINTYYFFLRLCNHLLLQYAICWLCFATIAEYCTFLANIFVGTSHKKNAANHMNKKSAFHKYCKIYFLRLPIRKCRRAEFFPRSCKEFMGAEKASSTNGHRKNVFLHAVQKRSLSHLKGYLEFCFFKWSCNFVNNFHHWKFSAGSSGMGQAQSQSSPYGCDGCYIHEQVLQLNGWPGSRKLSPISMYLIHIHF